MGNGITQQVLKRRGNALEHRPVHLHLAAADVQVGALAQLLRRLADDAVEPVANGRKGHHADSHQILLQVAAHARLGGKGGVGFIHRGGKVLVHGANVIDAFGHHACEFLKPREAVEFERVETLFCFGDDLLLGLHLRLGLDLDLAQLCAQAPHIVGELLQRDLEHTHLAFDTGAGDAHFTGLIDQAVNHISANPQHPGAHTLYVPRHGHGLRLNARDRNCGRHNSRTRCSLARRFVDRHLELSRILQPVKKVTHAINRGFEPVEQRHRQRTERDCVLDARFHVVGKLTQAHGAGHARTAF